MKAIRTINSNPELVEWIQVLEDGSIGTCATPMLFADTCTITALHDYWSNLGFTFNPLNLPIEVVVVELIVPADELLKMDTVEVQDENERKWKMKMLPSVRWDDKIYIDQFYIIYNDKPHRVRFNYEYDQWYRTSSGKQERKLRSIEFIHKEKIGIGQNKEHHIECSYDRAKELIETATKRITKVRHIHKADAKYEVDVFLHSTYPRGGFIMMEVETAEIDQELFIPDRIQEVMLEEVTGNKDYDNWNLATSYLGITD